MKKGKFLYFINWILVFSIPAILATTSIKTDEIAANVDVKNLKTNLFIKNASIPKQINKDIDIEVVEEEKNSEASSSTKDDSKQEEVNNNEIQKEIENVVKEEKKDTTSVEKNDSKDILTGKISYYRANCYGCSGRTASGYDVSNGNLYYHDATYGDIRIIAAGYELNLYSVVKIKNSSLGTDVLAIVLDRGGNIGQDKKFLIDVLTNDSESKGGVETNVSLEILRNGK